METLLSKIKLMLISLFTFQKEEVAVAGSPLKLDLQFFADPGAGDPNPDPKPSNPNPNPEPNPNPNPNPSNEHMIPKSRFDEVNTNYKTVKAELDELKEAQAAAERKAQEQQGEYQQLYETANQELSTFKSNYETANSRAEALEGVITSLLTTKLETIPEEFHDLIPENLSPEQKLNWVSKAEAKGLFKDSSKEPLGNPTNPGAQTKDLESLSAHQLLIGGYK